MSRDWDPTNRPEEPEDEQGDREDLWLRPSDGEDGGEGAEDPWSTRSDEPAAEDPWSRRAEPDAAGDAWGWPVYESPTRPAGPDEAAGEPVPGELGTAPARDRHSRDPLARLFPGLPHGARVAIDWILTIAGAVLIVLALKQWVVNPYRIPSSSMEPTLNCAKGPNEPGCLGTSSDRVLACRICLDFGAPSRGDIVVFNTPSKAALDCGEGGTFVKRLIGLPGENVREDDFGNIDIQRPGSKTWIKLKEPYLTKQRRLQDTEHFGKEWHVPKGEYFMMGDNRAQSCDSRTWGAVPRDKLIGIVFFTYWPPDRIHFY